MPAMVRSKSKATAIAYNIMGVPENLQHDEGMTRFRRSRAAHLKARKPSDRSNENSTYESLDMSY